MRRAVYTAVHAFKDNPRLRTGELKIVALPLIQETTNVPCDMGSPASELKEEFEKNQVPVDLSLCEEDWYIKVCFFFFFSYPITARYHIAKTRSRISLPMAALVTEWSEGAIEKKERKVCSGLPCHREARTEGSSMVQGAPRERNRSSFARGIHALFDGRLEFGHPTLG